MEYNDIFIKFAHRAALQIRLDYTVVDLEYLDLKLVYLENVEPLDYILMNRGGVSRSSFYTFHMAHAIFLHVQ